MIGDDVRIQSGDVFSQKVEIVVEELPGNLQSGIFLRVNCSSRNLFLVSGDKSFHPAMRQNFPVNLFNFVKQFAVS
jgi:hypothetical protein